jgi:cytidylate kinase
MGKIIIAVDGYSGCGKSSTAKAVAKILGYTYIDSGAMYRAATLHFLNQNTDLNNLESIKASLKSVKITFQNDEAKGIQETFLNGKNVEEEIRNMRVSQYVSVISKIKEVREDLVAQQQVLGLSKGVVMDGRDIGTVVFPSAELKLFMTADLEIRAKRRQKELFEKGQEVDLTDICDNLKERDLLDSTRKESPLVKAEDAIEIDPSFLDFQEQVNQIVTLAKDKMNTLSV